MTASDTPSGCPAAIQGLTSHSFVLFFCDTVTMMVMTTLLEPFLWEDIEA